MGGAGAPLPVLAPRRWRPALDYRLLSAAAASPTAAQHYAWLLRGRFNVVLDEDWRAPPNGTWWAWGGGRIVALLHRSSTSHQNR